jgi:hypothetical protein
MVANSKEALMLWRFGRKTFDVVFSDTDERSENVPDQFYDQVREELIKEGYSVKMGALEK